MAAENFGEFLNKLKEIHEREVHALQIKLNEVTSERSRDTQRIEELFAKNHQLREQQKALKENVKVLENRLRAGLCDRCQVTQELAKKKQHEFGKAHFQSLQHIFILTNEMNKLREENKSLKEELKRLCGTEDRPKHLKELAREGSSTPDSPLPLLSAQNKRSSTEKMASHEAEDQYEQRSSPGMRISPNTVLHGEHALEMGSQKIANQLHGTIALVRPGSRSCMQERDGSENATPPPANETPPSPQPDQSPSFEAYLRASKSDCHEIASPYETLKFTTRKEQLCLLNQHFALCNLGLRNNSINKEGGFPHHLLMAREAGGRTRSQYDWEDQATILELPGAVVYMKDHHLENRLQFLNHQEKLHYLLAQQQQQECKAKMEENLERAQCRLSSPLPRFGKGFKKERPCFEDSTNGTLGRLLLINREELEQGEKAEAMKEYLTEAPLDLSDSGRGRENLKLTSLQQASTEHEAGSPSKGQNEESFLQKSCLSSGLHEEHLCGSKELEQRTFKTQDTMAPPNSLQQELPISKPDSCDALTDSETEMPFGTENEETDQPADGDSESVKEESESDMSDSEMIGACEDESLQGVSMKEKYCCITEDIQRSQRKRKREPESWTKAHKKSGGKVQNGKATQVPGDAHRATKEMSNHSPSFRQDDSEET